MIELICSLCMDFYPLEGVDWQDEGTAEIFYLTENDINYVMSSHGDEDIIEMPINPSAEGVNKYDLEYEYFYAVNVGCYGCSPWGLQRNNVRFSVDIDSSGEAYVVALSLGSSDRIGSVWIGLASHVEIANIHSLCSRAS